MVGFGSGLVEAAVMPLLAPDKEGLIAGSVLLLADTRDEVGGTKPPSVVEAV